MAPIRLTLNGDTVEDAESDPHLPLLHWLRNRGLTGSKEGCAEGECGACAVALVRRSPQGRTRYDAVNSCLMLLGAADGQEVITVEGIGHRGQLHPVQRAMVEQGGSQCGYCTPGFVVSLFAEYYRPGRSGYDPEAISGNLCRCTGYRPIRDAARSLGVPDRDDPFAQRLEGSPPQPTSTEHDAGRRFHRPTRLDEVFAAMRAEPNARLVAGGTDVVVDMNQRGDRCETLVSIDHVEELQRFDWHDDRLEIGGAVPLREIEERMEGQLPMLEQLMPLFSSRLIRNRATLGGNLVTASPIGDAPPVLLALDAEVRLVSAEGERTVPLEEFFRGYRDTVLEPGEVLASVWIPRPFPHFGRFYKVSKRVLDDISTVAAAIAVDVGDSGEVTRARLAFGGVAPTPIRVYDAERDLEGSTWGARAPASVREVLARSVRPITDHRGSAAYRAAVVPKLLDKFYDEHGPQPAGGAA